MDIWLNTGGDQELSRLFEGNLPPPLGEIHSRQGEELVKWLEAVLPELAPAKAYVAHEGAEEGEELSIHSAVTKIYR